MPKPFKNTFEKCKAAAAGCESHSAFQRKAPREYETAYRQKWLDAICPKGLNPDQTRWTKERVAEVSKLYSSRSQMKASPHQVALKRAKANGWDDALPPAKAQRENWTKEECFAAAKQFKSTSEMREQIGQGAYKAMWRNGWVEECCAHMEDNAPSDNDSVYLWQATELTYNGLPVYKIGVTSARLGAQRIQRVARGAKLTPTIIFNRWVPDALALEKQLLAFGQDPLYCGFDGASEFRALTAADMAAMQSLVDSQAIL